MWSTWCLVIDNLHIQLNRINTSWIQNFCFFIIDISYVVYKTIIPDVFIISFISSLSEGQFGTSLTIYILLITSSWPENNVLQLIANKICMPKSLITIISATYSIVPINPATLEIVLILVIRNGVILTQCIIHGWPAEQWLCCHLLRSLMITRPWSFSRFVRC